MEKMIKENTTIKLPHRMGDISILKQKIKYNISEDGKLETKYLAVDWKATKELWANDLDAKERKVRVFHENKHTGGYVYKWKWYRGVSAIKNVRFYKFYPLRRWKRNLAFKLKDPLDTIDFYEV